MVENKPALLEDEINESRPLTREEFNKSHYDDDHSDKPLVDKLADKYDKCNKSSPILKIIKNIDPFTGILSDFLAENREKRDTEKLNETLYQYYIAIWVLTRRVNNITIDVEYIKQQLPALLEVYLDYSMKTYQLEKIEYFRNILINGLTDYNHEFDEKVNIFEIISSLTIRELRILEYIHDRSNERGTMMTMLELNEAFNDNISIDAIYLVQLCDNLVGKGLLSRVTDYGKLDAIGETRGYRKAVYTDRLIEYIKDYKQRVILIDPSSD